MALSRNWIFRISVAGNLFVLVYLALYSTSSSSAPPNSTSNYPTNNPLNPAEAAAYISANNAAAIHSSNQPVPDLPPQKPLDEVKTSGEGETPGGGDPSAAQSQQDPLPDDLPKEKINPDVDFDPNINDVNEQLINESRQLDNNLLKSPKLFPCDDYTPRRYYGQRGSYWVLYNYFIATKSFRCDQSITYTTHADWTFLDNLVPLLERWQGPLSLALYSPGTDFDDTVKRIHYLRECGVSPLVKELVTFHLFFDNRNVPKTKVDHFPEKSAINCSALQESITFGEGLQTYKKAKKLSYPVNVARNVAREMATTHYLLPSDIELYPNPNLIPDFLEMVRVNDSMLQRPAPKVFVLSIFEVEANVTALPFDKNELIFMLRNKSAIPFHKYVCADCHRIPKADEWLKMPYTSGMKVFHIGKRHKPYHHWEPIFIGTKFDPMYDERLSWEGRSDKMTQVREVITREEVIS